MSYLVAYICSLLVIVAIDATWLSMMEPILYRPALKEVLTPNLRIAPAVAFYLMYPIGVVTFAVMPALHLRSITSAFLLAALFGAIAYATYDLTNYATLRNWTLKITVVDIIFGASLSGVAAMTSFALVSFNTF